MNHIDQNLISELEKITDPKDLIGEIFRRFGNRAAIGTSFQLTGSVMIDLAIQAKIKPRVFTLDTLRLFPETYAFFKTIEKKYKITIKKSGETFTGRAKIAWAKQTKKPTTYFTFIWVSI